MGINGRRISIFMIKCEDIIQLLMEIGHKHGLYVIPSKECSGVAMCCPKGQHQLAPAFDDARQVPSAIIAELLGPLGSLYHTIRLDDGCMYCEQSLGREPGLKSEISLSDPHALELINQHFAAIAQFCRNELERPAIQESMGRILQAVQAYTLLSPDRQSDESLAS
jgi:hypothetical protein